MSATEFVVDDIVAEISADQELKLAQLWARLYILVDLPDFEPATIAALGEEDFYPTNPEKNANGSIRVDTPNGTPNGADTPSGVPVKIDMSIVKSKGIISALGDMSPEQLHVALNRNVKHEDPDTLLVRFLRARSWDPSRALEMLLKSLAWRLMQNVEEGLLAGGDSAWADLVKDGTGEEQKTAKEIMAMTSSGESFVHGKDRKGRPLAYIRVKLHDARAQGVEAFEKALMLLAETTRMALQAPNTTVSVVFDLTGFGMRNMDMNALKIMVSGMADNYPECLGSVYVYNAPWIINGIWSMIRVWLDPVIASKVQFISNVKALSEHIDPAKIPKYMGGQDDWEYTWIPPPTVDETRLSPEDEKKKEDLRETRKGILESHQAKTREWAWRVASQENAEKEQKERRAEAQKMRENYWLLDRYIRGSTMLDRSGVLERDGTVHF